MAAIRLSEAQYLTYVLYKYIATIYGHKQHLDTGNWPEGKDTFVRNCI